MSQGFSRQIRAAGPELLDGLEVGINVSRSHYQRIMSEVALLNRWTTGGRFKREFLRLLRSQSALKSRSVSVLDVGCGEGDRLLKLAEAFRRSESTAVLELHGIDMNLGALAQAQARVEVWLRRHPAFRSRVSFVWHGADAIEFLGPSKGPETSTEFDWICSSLMTHHLTDEAIQALLMAFDRSARWGWYIEDLHRHPVAYWGIKLLTSLLPFSAEVRHDAPLSVARGFRRQDWERIARACITQSKRGDNRRPTIEWSWAFRYVVRGGAFN